MSDHTHDPSEQGFYGARPRQISGQRLRLRAPRAEEPARTLRQLARWLGFFGLKPGPHATWQRPLSPGSLDARLERARAKLASTRPRVHSGAVPTQDNPAGDGGPAGTRRKAG